MTPRSHSQTQDVSVQETLKSIPPAAAMYLRDLIRGLEAEAGAARALASRADEQRVRDTEYAVHKALEFRDERDEAQSALAQAQARLESLSVRVTQLEVREAIEVRVEERAEEPRRGLKRFLP